MSARAGAATFVFWTLVGVCAGAVRAGAHNGPPFPLVSNRAAGAYDVSLWTDPDVTDDGSAAGRFWVILAPARAGSPRALDTRVVVSASPLDRHGPEAAGLAEPDGRDASRRFVALTLDREGRYAIRVAIDGPLGPAEIDATVDATYDLRPRPLMLGLALMPFLLVGVLWLKLLLRRRRGVRGR